MSESLQAEGLFFPYRICSEELEGWELQNVQSSAWHWGVGIYVIMQEHPRRF